MIPASPLVHIVNGDSILKLLQAMAIPGEYVSWSDLLIEGPVEHAEKRRAGYFADKGMGDYRQLLKRYQQRSTLASWLRSCDEVLLWFDDNVVSQLQFYQLLSVLACEPALMGKLKLPDKRVFAAHVPLPRQSMETLLSSYQRRLEITPAQQLLALDIWRQFVSGQPQHWAALFSQDLSSLPFARKTLMGLMELLPSSENGLSKLQQQLLQRIGDEGCTAAQLLYDPHIQLDYLELTPTSLYLLLMPLYFVAEPLITVRGPLFVPEAQARWQSPTHLQLTDGGRQVLNGDCDYIDINGIDRWLGGLHLSIDNIWRHQPQQHLVMKTCR